MENQTNSVTAVPEEPQEETQAVVSRRRLLKSLVISGGAVAGLTMLPEKWTRPVVEAGELSVHAEASPALRISDLDMDSGCFNFEDYYAGVTDTATLHARLSSNGSSSCSSGRSEGDCDGPVSASITNVSGAGETTGLVCFSYPSRTNGTQLCVKLEAKGRLSNELCT